jgi:16S rRNA (adenine1518-N6/adenine1519-N6)-dimethyltransferase
VICECRPAEDRGITIAFRAVRRAPRIDMAIRPKKRFGQNFLRNEHVIASILAAADLSAADRVLEIGPGLGALTDRLLDSGASLLAIEIDFELADQLSQRSAPGLAVQQGDVLKLDWEALLPAPPYKLVANLPYNISSQILFRILDHRQLFSRLVLMFQKEVGDRIVAGPATRDYGILSVLMQTWFDVKRVVRVSPGSFFPPPKVESVVLQFDPLPAPRFAIDDEQVYRRLVRGAFTQRRKTLRNSLLGSGWSAETVDRMLAVIGIDPKRRGETLTLREFADLSNSLGC